MVYDTDNNLGRDTVLVVMISERQLPSHGRGDSVFWVANRGHLFSKLHGVITEERDEFTARCWPIIPVRHHPGFLQAQGITRTEIGDMGASPLQNHGDS